MEKKVRGFVDIFFKTKGQRFRAREAIDSTDQFVSLGRVAKIKDGKIVKERKAHGLRISFEQLKLISEAKVPGYGITEDGKYHRLDLDKIISDWENGAAK